MNLKVAYCMVGALLLISLTSQESRKKWLAPTSAKELKNPRKERKGSIENGAKIYKMRCTLCHGNEGKGDGVGGRSLNPKPANHTTLVVQNQTDGEIFWKITYGRGKMVGWGKGSPPIISEIDRWDLVNYIRTLKTP